MPDPSTLRASSGAFVSSTTNAVTDVAATASEQTGDTPTASDLATRWKEWHDAIAKALETVKTNVRLEDHFMTHHAARRAMQLAETYRRALPEDYRYPKEVTNMHVDTRDLGTLAILSSYDKPTKFANIHPKLVSNSSQSTCENETNGPSNRVAAWQRASAKTASRFAPAEGV
jgi:hypothetical protein